MTDTVKVLGQVVPSATTLTALYTVPAATSAVVSSIVVCNQGATETTFRIAIAPAGAVDNPKHYTQYDCVIPGNETYISTSGFTLATTDVVRVYAGNASLSFNIFGVEVS